MPAITNSTNSTWNRGPCTEDDSVQLKPSEKLSGRFYGPQNREAQQEIERAVSSSTASRLAVVTQSLAPRSISNELNSHELSPLVLQSQTPLGPRIQIEDSRAPGELHCGLRLIGSFLDTNQAMFDQFRHSMMAGYHDFISQQREDLDFTRSMVLGTFNRQFAAQEALFQALSASFRAVDFRSKQAIGIVSAMAAQTTDLKSDILAMEDRSAISRNHILSSQEASSIKTERLAKAVEDLSYRNAADYANISVNLHETAQELNIVIMQSKGDLLSRLDNLESLIVFHQNQIDAIETRLAHLEERCK